MVDISFSSAGQFQAAIDGSGLLSNPTSLQFGPDGRLYVSEQTGTINAFDVALQNGQYVATGAEEINLVKTIQNHNDDGSVNGQGERQVTGFVTTGTAENPVLYVSSSDPRIADNGEVNLDTNSGVITRLTRNGGTWQAVDIVRGLPRSEQNHSTNGLVLSPDGTKLYVAQGGNTSNGAPSRFFSYTGEYALSGAVLEVDLNDINSRAIQTDFAGGQNGAARQYVYDLPTLDDPSVANDGSREDGGGLDVAGPWGGNDGLNMSILPADAPLRIYADGLRNNFDLVISQSGQLYTVDNGSNDDFGGDPIDGADGQPTNLPNDGGSGDSEPLFLIEDGGYYGHPNPTRSNQDLTWTVYNDNGTLDGSVFPNTVPDLSALVPDGVNIQDGFIIDPSKFTADAGRLAQSGDRVEHDSPQSNSLVTLGSSSNGLVEYTGNAFDGALNGSLLVAQFNGNVTALNLNDAGTGLAPLIGPGDDGLVGTADDETVDVDGVYPLLGGFSQALDVTTGPNDSIWVSEIGGDTIKAFAPESVVPPTEPPTEPPTSAADFDNDGLNNTIDPFIRDPANGAGVTVQPGQTLLWDFDPNQDNNLPGPNGYGGGLTGVMVDGSTDFEDFFQTPSSLPGQTVKLDNVKFITAAGGGTTVIENVSNGDAYLAENDGEYLFHTGVTVAPTVEEFTIKWSAFNPGSTLGDNFQQLGGYIGTGDQQNYLKLVAIQNINGEIQLLLEDNDTIQSLSDFRADDIFSVPGGGGQKVFFELTVNPTAETAKPTVTYETPAGNKTVIGEAISLSSTSVLDAIKGNYTVQGQPSGLAVGLFSSNTGAPGANAFQAAFDDIEITATGDGSADPVVTPTNPGSGQVLYRVNAGGPQIAATDGGIAWSADTLANNSPFLTNAGSNDNTQTFAPVDISSLPVIAGPATLFNTERWDEANDTAGEMQWAFDVEAGTGVEVRLYMAETHASLIDFNNSGDLGGDRLFDVSVDGTVPEPFTNIDTYQLGGNALNGASVVTHQLTSDGTIDLEFIHNSENPAVKAIEIVAIEESDLLVSGQAAITAQSVESPLTGDSGQSILEETLPASDFLAAGSLLTDSQTEQLVEPSPLLAVETVT